jgi:uracil-DNA glycosylase family 4
MYVQGEGNPRARLLVVSDMPSKEDFLKGHPFSGMEGTILDSMLGRAGISRDEIFLTNIFKNELDQKQIPKRGLTSTSPLLESALTQIREEIRVIKPNCILALGELPLQALCGVRKVEDYRGSILRTTEGGVKVVPTIHPSKLIETNSWDKEKKKVFKYSARIYIQLDYNRAVEESKSNEYKLPYRDLITARSSLQLQRFLSAYKNPEVVSVDIESHNCLPTCIAFSFHPNNAISIPLTRLLSPNCTDGLPMGELREVWRVIDKFFRTGIKVVGQNFKFDQEKLQLLGFKGINFYADTMFMSHVLYPEFPKSLQFLTSVHTREPFYKTEGKEYHPLKDSFDRMLKYNAKDAAVTLEIYQVLLGELHESGIFDFYHPNYRRYHDLYRNMERRGIRLDADKRSVLKTKYEEQRARVQGLLNTEIGHPINVSSPKQIDELLYDELKIPVRDGTGEDILVAILNNVIKDERRKNIIRWILELRRVKKTLSSYLEALPDFDGRMRTSYRIVGTETGRTSTTLLEPPLRQVTRGLAFQTMTKHGDVGADLREILIPDPNYLFCEVDLSQAEARIVALLSEDYELLKRFTEGNDVHTETAAEIMFGSRSFVAKVTKDMRFIGKESRHAGNYDVKKARFMQMVNSDAKKFHIDVEISEYRAGKILEKFHAMHPKVKDVFHHQVVDLAEQNNRTLVNPFGRVRQFTDRWNEKTFREMYAFLPQSTVADHVKRAMLRLLDQLPGLQFLMETHDSFLVQLRVEEAGGVIPILIKELEVPIDFSSCTLKRGTLVIPAEAQVGMNYKDLIKWKPGKS